MNLRIKNNFYIIFPFVSALLLSFGWPSSGFPFLLLIAFIPLFILDDKLREENNHSNRKIFFYSWLAFFIWNLLTTYWIYFATPFGAAFAIICNSLFMALTFLLSSCIKAILKKYSKTSCFADYSIIFFWISFEFLHHNWELSWTWLTLGNGFANYPLFIQWYEYTGIFGGSLWIILTNIVLYKLIQRKTNLSEKIIFAVILILPLFSLARYYTYKETNNKVNIVVVQPNFDPYSEKFGGIPQETQLRYMLKLAESKIKTNTKIIIFPETAISESLSEDNLQFEPSIIMLKDFISQHKNINILIGLSSYKFYNDKSEISESARMLKNNVDSISHPLWYDAYNSAILIDTALNIQLYHKSKLVPGVERMPYPAVLSFLEKYALDMGGTSGSLGIDKDAKIMKTGAKKTDLLIAPAICYESIFGEFITNFITLNANIICIITNDGWWKDTPGYKQHFQYARLRAIETRRSIARSANTGISGFFNQKGDILDKTNWWTPDCISYDLNLNDKTTFYVKFGDYIGRLAIIISFLLILISVLIKFLKNKR